MRPALPAYAIFEEGGPASVTARAFGRKMIAALAASSLRVQQQVRGLSDGTVLIAQRAGTQYRLTIQSPAVPSQETEKTKATIWIPTGFVLYPSAAASVAGWGLPPLVTGQPWNHLSVDPFYVNWTPGGPLGEVLLTDRVQAGYPNRKYLLLPLMAPTSNAPIGYKTIANKPARAATGWNGYRPAFGDFLQLGGILPDQVRRSLFEQANTRRTDIGRDAMTLPLRGFYDEAQLAANLARQFGVTSALGTTEDATLGVKAPAGYKPATQRLARDGICQHTHDIATTQLSHGQTLMDAWAANGLADADFDTGSQLGVGRSSGLLSAGLSRREQWIGYGNQFWIGTDKTLPILSWRGLPAAMLTIKAATGTEDGPSSGSYTSLDNYITRVRGQSYHWFTDALYASGRQIGKLPGLVIGAGIRALPISEGQAKRFRVVVICWHAADHTVTDGCYVAFAHFRVWFQDMVDDAPFGPRLLNPAIGEYDATTNPFGWRFAGTFDAPRFSSTMCQFFSQWLWQTWRFSHDGQRALSVVGPDINSAIPGVRNTVEITFSAVDDAVLTIGVAYSPQNGGIDADPIYAADYDDNDRIIVIDQVLSEWTTADDPEKWPPGTDTLQASLRWNGTVLFPADTGSISPAALYLSTTAIHILDVARGVIAFLDAYPTCNIGEHKLRVRIWERGSITHTAEYTDSTFFEVSSRAECVRPDLLLTSYARDRDGNRVVAYELEGKQGGVESMTRQRSIGEFCDSYIVAAEVPLAADTFVGSWADIAGPSNTFIGDLTTLMGVPATQLRVFPVGVV